MEEESVFMTCPRCGHKIEKGTKICPYCNIEIDKVNDKPDSLNFALTEETSLVDLETISQVPNRKMIINRKIYNILLLIVGFIGVGMLFYPLFGYGNYYSHLVRIGTSYGIAIDESLALEGGTTNFIGLLGNIIDCLPHAFSFNDPSSILLGYEILMSAFCVTIAILSLVIIAFAIKSMIADQDYHYHRNIMGVILSLSLIMVFGFDMFGAGPIIMAVVSFFYLLYVYLSGVLTHEKKFILNQLLFKSITMGLILAMLILSSVGANDINLTEGRVLYCNEELTLTLVRNKDIMYCRGLFVEIAQFIQLSSPYSDYSVFIYFASGLCMMAHLAFIIVSAISISYLLNSLSRQNLRFPEKRIITMTVLFYLFFVFLLFVNGIINSDIHQKYVDLVGRGIYDSYTSQEKIELEESLMVFFLRGGMIGSIIISLPLMIYSLIASKLLVRKKFN